MSDTTKPDAAAAANLANAANGNGTPAADTGNGTPETPAPDANGNGTAEKPEDIGSNWLAPRREMFTALVDEAIKADGRWSAVLIGMICYLASLGRHPVINPAWCLSLRDTGQKMTFWEARNLDIFRHVCGWIVGNTGKRPKVFIKPGEELGIEERRKLVTASKRAANFVEIVARREMLGEVTVNDEAKCLRVPGKLLDAGFADGVYVDLDGQEFLPGRKATMVEVIRSNPVPLPPVPETPAAPETRAPQTPASVPADEQVDADGNTIKPAAETPASDAPSAGNGQPGTDAPAGTEPAADTLGFGPVKAWDAKAIPTIAMNLSRTIDRARKEHVRLSETASTTIAALMFSLVLAIGADRAKGMMLTAIADAERERQQQRADEQAERDAKAAAAAEEKRLAAEEAQKLLAAKPIEPPIKPEVQAKHPASAKPAATTRRRKA